MRFTAITFLAIISTVLAAPSPTAQDTGITGLKEEPAPGQETFPDDTNAPRGIEVRTLDKRGFGCPGNPYACSEHCKTLKGGRTGGYCGGPWYLGHPTCICVFG